MLQFFNKLKIKLFGNIDLLFYIAALAFAVSIKIFYRAIDDFPGAPALMLFLKPLSTIVGLFFGISFVFDDEKGFCSGETGVVIGSSCAGVNFFVIVFCMLVFTFIRVFRAAWHKAAAFTAFIAVSYILSVLANASRIIASMSVMAMHILPAGMDAGLVHELTGILFYLVYLICGFNISKIILSKVGSTYETAS